MLSLRRSDERGHFNFGWLDTHHSFSFGDYYDPRFLGFSALRVINEDRVAPGKGFPTHSHRDMEIITYILDGALEHKDSLGTGSVIRSGDVQRMSAGSGIQHSEYNHSGENAVHFLQIWILPERKGLAPGYEQKSYMNDERRDRLRLIGSRDGREDSITIHQDLDLYGGELGEGTKLEHLISEGRLGWVQLASGAVEINGLALGAGDGLAVTKERLLAIKAIAKSNVLLFDLPGG